MAKRVAGAAAADVAADRMATKKARVVFTPSGRSGAVFRSARLCSKQRVAWALTSTPYAVVADFVVAARLSVQKAISKHAIHSLAENLTPIGDVETRYSQRRKLKPLAEGRRLSCQAQIQGDLVIDVPPESQMHRQVVRKDAEHRDITLDTGVHLYYVEVQRSRHA